MRNTLGSALARVMSAKKSHHLFCGDIGFRIFDAIQEQTPEQFHNFGISEQHMVSFASSFATRLQATSILYTINPFITSRVHDQLRVDVAYSNSPLLVVSVGAGFAYDSLGFTHFGLEDLALINSLPNMRVVTPCDPADVERLIFKIFETQRISSPIYMRLHKGGEPSLDDVFGQSTYDRGCRCWDGHALTIVSHGAIVFEALKARDRLKDEVSIRVLAVSEWSEFLESGLNLLQGPLVFLEEAAFTGSLASLLMKTIALGLLSNKVLATFHVSDALHEGMVSRQALLSRHNLDSDSLVKVIRTRSK